MSFIDIQTKIESEIRSQIYQMLFIK